MILPSIMRSPKAPDWWDPTAKSIDENFRRVMKGASVSVGAPITSQSLPLGGGSFFTDASSGDVTLTLPSAASAIGNTYIVKKIDGSVNQVIIDGAGSELIDDAMTLIISGEFDAVTLQSDGAQWWIC